MTNTKLLTSIYDYLGTISNIPKLLYPNIEYSSLPDEYIRVFVMNATPDDIGVKNISMKSGIIQCNVTIKESIGEIKASEIADLIIASFPRNTVIPTSKIRIDTAVNCLVIEPNRNIISEVIGTSSSRLAIPNPFAYISSPSFVIIIAAPGSVGK